MAKVYMVRTGYATGKDKSLLATFVEFAERPAVEDAAALEQGKEVAFDAKSPGVRDKAAIAVTWETEKTEDGKWSMARAVYLGAYGSDALRAEMDAAAQSYRRVWESERATSKAMKDSAFRESLAPAARAYRAAVGQQKSQLLAEIVRHIMTFRD